MSAKPKPAARSLPQVDWRRVVSLVQCSRAMDALEEQHLVPGKKIFYQFSARGHDMAQVLLGLHLTHPKDAICGYYRSRPILLSLGVKLEDALGSAMGVVMFGVSLLVILAMRFTINLRRAGFTGTRG